MVLNTAGRGLEMELGLGLGTCGSWGRAAERAAERWSVLSW